MLLLTTWSPQIITVEIAPDVVSGWRWSRMRCREQ